MANFDEVIFRKRMRLSWIEIVQEPTETDTGVMKDKVVHAMMSSPKLLSHPECPSAHSR